MTFKILPVPRLDFSGLPPSSADWISLVAPTFSVLPSAPPAFSADGQRRSRQFLECPESLKARKNCQERGYGAVRSQEVRKEAREGGRLR